MTRVYRLDAHPARAQTLAMAAALPAFDEPLLRQMAARGNVRTFPAHAVLINEGDRGDSIYIVLDGRVKVYSADANGREVIYNTHGPGEYFGELSLDGGARSASVMALTATACVVVPGPEVRDFIASHPDFAMHLVHKLCALVRRASRNVRSLALEDVYGRVAGLLQELAPDHDGRRVVAERLTQKDIANRVGASREMVSRILTQLRVGGYIAVQARRIVLLKKLPPGW